MKVLLDELLLDIFADQPHPLAQPMAAWLASSRRFATFVATFRDKIRKKIRTTQEPESLLDLRLELETAYHLLQDRTLSLAYEPQPHGLGRRPDFAVTYTTSLTFLLEVTRQRVEQKNGQAGMPESVCTPSSPTSLPADRLADTVCNKLHQLLPQRSNVLLVAVEGHTLTHAEIAAAMLRLQQRAERNDAALWQRHRFRDRTDFFQHYQRLSEVVVRTPYGPAGEGVVAWVNPQAKNPLPSRVRTALHQCH